MERPVCYDVTRLLSRVLNATPNGIDRVDFALATHFLAKASPHISGLTSTGFGARLIDGTAAAEAVRSIGTLWREADDNPESDPAFRRVVEFLHGGPAGPAEPRRRTGGRRDRLSAIATWVRRHGLPIRRTPDAGLPKGTVYFNVSQFPLWVSSSFTWLERRPDVRAAFFIHDLLPIRLPEYFRAAEEERHHRRLANLARFGAAAIVTTRTVAADLESHLATLGRRDLPLFVAPTPIAPIFTTPRRIDPALGNRPYFIFCSTLEPRKNHLMLLAAWRALVDRSGGDAPKLILIGTRGWHYDPILDLMARSPALRANALEIGGLSTPALKRLIDNCQAVLMPSFGEGYGLPVHEALTAGAPVIAADIPAFREITSSELTLISPLDGEAWLSAIWDRARTARPATATQQNAPRVWSDYFVALERFLDAL